MADQLTTGWLDLLYELRGPLQKAYPKGRVLLQRLQRDTSRKNFSGNQVRVPIFAAPLQGAHMVAEGGNITIPQVDDTAQAHIKMAHAALPISLSPELMKQTKDNAAAKAVASKTQRAGESMARTANEQLNGDGTGKIADVSGGGTSLTATLDAGAPRRQLYKGRIVDVVEPATGVAVTQGLKRKIDSITLNTDGTVASVTFLTGGFGGGSGNLTFTATCAIYIQDSVQSGPVFNAAQGVQQIGAITGTFEDINKATNDWWQGTLNAYSGVDPDLGIMDAGILNLGERTDRDKVDWIVGDPGVILLYQSAFYNQMRFEPTRGKLDTGFEGPVYNGMVMIGDFDHQRGALTGVTEEDLQMYGYEKGPDWDDLTGSMFQRFGTATTRSRNVEAWLVDDYQLGAHECRTMVRWTGLNRAS
jgi:hypothetical protein